MQKNTLPKEGMIGAFLGSFIALFIWIILYHFVYVYFKIPEPIVFGMGGITTAVFTIKGYEKLNHTIDKTGISICLITMVIMTFISLYSSMAVELYIEFNMVNSISFSNSFSAIPRLIKLDNGKDFITNLISAYVCMSVTQHLFLKYILKASVSTDIEITEPDK